MEVKASLRKLRMSPQKVRLVVDKVRGQTVNQALRDLNFMPQKAAYHVRKLVRSAVANAEQTRTVDVDNLYIKAISVDMGQTLKRFLPRAKGRATMLKKRGSHINLVLDER